MRLKRFVEDIVALPAVEVVDGYVVSPKVLVRTSDGELHNINYSFIRGTNELIIDVSAYKQAT